MINDVGWRTVVDAAAVAHNETPIKQVEEFGARLMDRGDYCGVSVDFLLRPKKKTN